MKRPFRGCLPCVKAVVWHSDMRRLALPDGRFCVARRLVLRSAVAFVARKRGAKRAAVSVLPFFGVAFSCSLCLQKLLPAWRSGAAMQVSPFASPRVCDSVACAVLLAFSAQNEAKKCVHGRQCAGFLLPLQAVNRVRAKKPRLHPHRRYAHCAPCAQSPRHRGGWSACITSIKKTRKWKRQKDKSVCCSCCSAYCFAFAS